MIAIVVFTLDPSRPVVLWTIALSAWLLLSLGLRLTLVPATLGLYVVMTATLLNVNVADLPPRAQIYGLVATAICVLPFILVPLATVDGFPFLHIFCLVQAVYLYVGFLLGRPDLANILVFPTDMREAGLLAYVGFVTVLVAVGLLCTKRRKSSNARRWIDMLDRTPVTSRVLNRAVALFAFGFAIPKVFEALGISDRLGTIPDFLSSLRIAAYAVVVLLWLSGKLTPAQKMVAIGLGMTDMLVGLSTGGVYNGTPLAFAVLTVLIATQRRALGLALILAVFFALALNSAKTEYRVESALGEVRGNPLARGGHLVGLAAENVFDTSTDTFAASASRFSYADLLGYVVQKVPDEYPYWNKRSYTMLPLAFVPRIINPWKPEYTLANEFGRTYGLISPTDFASATNIPIPVEAYANFGRIGMLVAGGITGALLALAGRRWGRDTLSELIVASVCATALVAGIESGVTTWIVVVPLALVLGPVTRWIFAGEDTAVALAGERVAVPVAAR
ncbi:MAG: hypothetical protein ACR2KK_06615 [Acidimicrobiales bacterium]